LTCFDRLVKTLDDVNIQWEFNNQDDLVAQNYFCI